MRGEPEALAVSLEPLAVFSSPQTILSHSGGEIAERGCFPRIWEIVEER